MSIRATIRQKALGTPEGTSAQHLPHGRQQVHQKMVEYKNLLKYWQGPSSAQLAPIANKEEGGGLDFSEQGKTAEAKKDLKGKFNGSGMVNDHFLSD